jgi:hypothetical protein
MYLFTRSGRVRPEHLQESMAWAVKVTEKVNQISEVPVTLWTPFASAGVGSLTWVAMFEELAVLEATDAKLMADPGYLALLQEGGPLFADSGADDSLWQMVHADPDAATAQPQYVNLVQALLAPGHMVRGIELGVEIAQQAKAITGRPTSFSMAQTGAYGAVEWSGLADTVDQLHAARQALNSDAEFAQLLDGEASVVYMPEATQAIYRKIA